jgi:hypothetical protein
MNTIPAAMRISSSVRRTKTVPGRIQERTIVPPVVIAS